MADEDLLDRLGFEVAFWTICDPGLVSGGLAVIGRDDRDRWRAARMHVDAPGSWSDAAALARDGDSILVVGSHRRAHKPRRLDAHRAFTLRVEELGLGAEVGLRPFALHRAVNDAIGGVEPSEAARSIISDTHHPEVRSGDAPIVVGGAVCEPDGTLVIGLRYPLGPEGGPLLARMKQGSSEIVEVVEAGNRGVLDLGLAGDGLQALLGDPEADLADPVDSHLGERWQVEPAKRIDWLDSDRVSGMSVEGDDAWFVRVRRRHVEIAHAS